MEHLVRNHDDEYGISVTGGHSCLPFLSVAVFEPHLTTVVTTRVTNFPVNI